MTTTEAASENRAIKLNASWRQKLDDQFQADYMQALRQFLLAEKALGKHIFPPGDEIFSALNVTEFDAVKVVILGQDPYHGPRQAHGLCFSVKPGVQVPPSLKNIYKELQADVDFEAPPMAACRIGRSRVYCC